MINDKSQMMDNDSALQDRIKEGDEMHTMAGTSKNDPNNAGV
jgi:hypothetical protein